MILASVQTASDAAPMTWGVVLTMLGAVVLLVSPLVGAWLLAHLEEHTLLPASDDELPVAASLDSAPYQSCREARVVQRH